MSPSELIQSLVDLDQSAQSFARAFERFQAGFEEARRAEQRRQLRPLDLNGGLSIEAFRLHLAQRLVALGLGPLTGDAALARAASMSPDLSGAYLKHWSTQIERSAA